MKQITVILTFFAAVICSTSCNNNNQANADCQRTVDSLKALINGDHSGEASALAAVDSLWSIAANTKGEEGFMSYYATGVIQLPPNDKILTAKEDVEKSVKALYAVPEVSLSWKAIKVEV